jgi:hypothetical protein
LCVFCQSLHPPHFKLGAFLRFRYFRLLKKDERYEYVTHIQSFSQEIKIIRKYLFL